MKISRLLTSILYEPWMILPSAAEAHLPVIAGWLDGKEIAFEARPEKFEITAIVAGRFTPGNADDIQDMEDGTIAVVPLKGEMMKYDGMCSYGTASISNVVRQLAWSKNISGMVLDMDGPGGAVNAIAPMVEAMQQFRQTGKPLIVHGDLVASAHLYVAVHGDYFMLDNDIASQAGSVGTMIQFADYAQYFESKGIKLHTIYAPESTHKNKEFEEALTGEYSAMKENILSPLARKFQDAVRTRRAGKLNENAEGILNGAMFFGGDAVKYGLADRIGTLGDAIQAVSDRMEVNRFMRKT